MSTFLGSADLQCRLTALLSGVLGHGSAAQAFDPASGCDEVFLGVFHSVNSTLVGRELVSLGGVGSGTGLGLDAT